MPADVVTLALCGDVMLGRGVDQVLAHPGDPTLCEPHIIDARDYVMLAERANGPVPRPVDDAWPWGDALAALEEATPDVRVVNLETSVTTNSRFAPGKAVHYRMAPDNLGSLAVARPDVCVLANNHVLDFGREGLAETLQVLEKAGLQSTGAGHDLGEACRPAAVPLEDGARVLVVAVGMGSSGVPVDWAATDDRSGVAFVEEPSAAAADALIALVERHRTDGDLVVASIHWGSNWGQAIPDSQVRFAHALVDGGVDVVHGHSSHHPRPVEVYRDRLVLYGCGDLINDYEGIGGHQAYRSDLRLLYLASLHRTGALAELRMVPLRARRLRLDRTSRQDAEWMRATLDQVSRRFGTAVRLDTAGANDLIVG